MVNCKSPWRDDQGLLSEGSACRSGEESEAAQIGFGPAGGLQDAAEGLAG
jgi:hypothetical protein